MPFARTVVVSHTGVWCRVQCQMPDEVPRGGLVYVVIPGGLRAGDNPPPSDHMFCSREEAVPFVKVVTSDEDTRWINLNLISRASVGKDESGVEILIAVFANGNAEPLRIRGTDDVNKEAILEIERALNQHCA